VRAFDLARWFQTERYANRPEDDFVREEILNDLADAEALASGLVGGVHTTLVRTPNGACMVEFRVVEGAPLVLFDYVRHDRWERTKFWMNESSVSDLLARLDSVPQKAFDDLFVGATT
jgi:hypothetical protein